MELIKNNKLFTAIILAVIAGLTAFITAWNSEETPAVEDPSPAVETALAAAPVEPAAEAPATEAPAAEAPATSETEAK